MIFVKTCNKRHDLHSISIMAPSIIDLTKDESTTIPTVPQKTSGFSKYPELRSALKNIQLPTLLLVVESLCESSEVMAKIMHERLVLPASATLPFQQKTLKRTAAEAMLGGMSSDRETKRINYRFLRCVRCDVDFNVEDNEHRECEYHPGRH